MADSIPEGILREHVLEAISRFNAGVPHQFADSTAYDLLHDGNRYPPKAIVGMASEVLTGIPFSPKDFKGGLESKCFRILQENGFEIVPKLAGRSNTWLFQGNPKLFDIDDYLTRYQQLVYWRTPTHRNSISLGDRAFMWRSGESSGIIASGVVVELPAIDPHLKHPEALGADLWMADELAARRTAPDVPKVGISLDSVRLTEEEGMIPRTILKDDPSLSQNTIIRQPNSTVFSVTPEQANRLEELWGGSISKFNDSFEASALEGDKKVYSHRRRERSRFLVGKKLEQARRAGAIRCEVCHLSEAGAYPPPFASRIFEVHHLMPLSQVETPRKTTLDDLAVVCANCHRAIHATNQVEKNFLELKLSFERGD